MKHLEVAEIAELLTEEKLAEICRHLVEVCPICKARFGELEALMKRFRHWDAEMLVGEAPAAEELLDALLDKRQGAAEWASVAKEEVEYQTWCVAWVALERAQALMAEDAARGRDLALLAVAIAGNLGDSYDRDSIADLEALAYATAAAAAEPPGGEDTLRRVAAAVNALDKGTGDPDVAKDVMGLLAQVFRKAAE